MRFATDYNVCCAHSGVRYPHGNLSAHPNADTDYHTLSISYCKAYGDTYPDSTPDALIGSVVEGANRVCGL